MAMTSKEIAQEPISLPDKPNLETYWVRELCLQIAELRELLIRIANKFGM